MVAGSLFDYLYIHLTCCSLRVHVSAACSVACLACMPRLTELIGEHVGESLGTHIELLQFELESEFELVVVVVVLVVMMDDI